MLYILVLFASVLLLYLIYLYTTQNHSYWAKRNVKHETPVPIFGNHFPVIFGKKTDAELYADLYRKYSGERMIGYYKGTTPLLILRDPELVKHVLNLDFKQFHARGVGADPKIDPLMLNIGFMDGDNWKLLRKFQTPEFTNKKIKNMFKSVPHCLKKFAEVADSISTNGKVVKAFDLLCRFNIEFLGACGFNIDLDTINNENAFFMKLVANIFVKSKLLMLRLGLRELFPNLRVVQNLKILTNEVTESFIEMTQKLRNQRNGKPSGQNDFMDLLLELESMNKLSGKTLDGSSEVELKIDVKVIAAQIFAFFVGGFETSASSASFTLHQLAHNPDIQKEIQDEIDSVLLKYNNELCFDAIGEMSLLNMAFKEALRIFPPAGSLNRICMKQYTIPGTDVTIDPGVLVQIPVQALHLDEKYYDSPEEFRPQRFSSEASRERNKYVYLPFGEGPRKCIAEPLGHMMSMSAMITLLQKFTVLPAPGTQRQHKLRLTSVLVQGVDGGVPIILKARKTNK